VLVRPDAPKMGNGAGIDDFYRGTAIAWQVTQRLSLSTEKKDFRWLHIPVACLSKALLP
jgi:hypothetical protein